MILKDYDNDRVWTKYRRMSRDELLRELHSKKEEIEAYRKRLKYLWVAFGSMFLSYMVSILIKG